MADAFYDTDLDITWLRDANVNGLMNWQTAASWVDSFSIGAFNDCRPPQAAERCGDSVCACASSEMGPLWYDQLGN